MSKSFKELVERVGPIPSVLAVPAVWEFVPEEASTEYLRGLLEGTYDGMNGPLTEEEREQARRELERRGVDR